MLYARHMHTYRITTKRQSSINMSEMKRANNTNEKANVHGDPPGRCVIHFEANELITETKLRIYMR